MRFVLAASSGTSTNFTHYLTIDILLSFRDQVPLLPTPTSFPSKPYLYQPRTSTLISSTKSGNSSGIIWILTIHLSV